ncbi:MAG: porin [Gammaproteobacteria bacterium]|nr:porin [Gammaproteobacteria bacterium]
MKKNLIAIAIAAAVAAPLTAQAAVNLSGDAEFVMQHTEAVTGVSGGWAGTNEVRVKIDADLGGGVGVHGRMRLENGDSHATTLTGGASNQVTTDYAYLTAKAGPASLKMGDQLATWGTKVWIEGTLKQNRLAAGFKPSDALSVGVFLDPYYDGGEGKPQINFNAQFKLSNMMKAGLLYLGKKTITTGTDVDAMNNIYVKGQMSGIVFGFESMDAGGASRANYLMAGMKAGGANLELHYLDGKTADADWSPVGVINGDANLAGSSPDITVITAGMKAGGMDITAGIGQAATGATGSTKESLVGIDLGKKMGAADFNFSYGTYNSASSYGFSFKTKF